MFSSVSALPGNRWSANVLADVQPASPTDGGLLRLKLSDFPALAQEFGSVRLGTSAIGSNRYPLGLFYPVIINRGAEGHLYAMEAACTHEGCTVPIYDPSIQCMQCPCHGSQYHIDGTVRRGPANFPLQPYTIRSEGADGLAIELPDVSFSLTALKVNPGAGRVRLDFLGFENIAYEVRSRPSWSAEWSGPMAFALTAMGPANQTSLVGTADVASVYVDQKQAAGFYAVTMRVSPV